VEVDSVLSTTFNKTLNFQVVNGGKGDKGDKGSKGGRWCRWRRCKDGNDGRDGSDGTSIFYVQTKIDTVAVVLGLSVSAAILYLQIKIIALGVTTSAHAATLYEPPLEVGLVFRISNL